MCCSTFFFGKLHIRYNNLYGPTELDFQNITQGSRLTNVLNFRYHTGTSDKLFLKQLWERTSNTTYIYSWNIFVGRKSTNKHQWTANVFRGASATVIVWFSVFTISLRTIYHCKLQSEISRHSSVYVTNYSLLLSYTSSFWV